MRQARQKAAKRAAHNRHQAERLAYFLELAKAKHDQCRHGEGEDGTACCHEWMVEGQTLTGYIESCTKCGTLRFG